MVDKCGTYAGWQAHNKRRERPCDPCRRKRNDYQRWRYAEGSRLATPPVSKSAIGSRYRAGCGLAELGRVFGRHPQTIRKIVEGQGIELRRHATRGRPAHAPCLDQAQRNEMATRYRAGWSLRELARTYRVSYGTAHNTLASVGVQFRGHGGES